MDLKNLLNKNLQNTSKQVDLFGNKITRISMKEKLGFLPLSIWEPDWKIVRELKKLIGDKGQSRQIQVDNGNFRGGSDKCSTYGYQDFTSVFNPHLAQMILAAYAPKNARIYDPFGGGGTRGFIASAMGHSYFGKEIRQVEVTRILEQQNKLGLKFDIFCGDALEAYPEKDCFNFSYTCPPYYDLEIYSKLENDLSHAKSYKDFLEMLTKVVQNVYDVLKPGSFSIWTVGNFRDKSGELIHFNGDLVRIAKEIGFIMHDEIIFWGASKCASQRSGQFSSNRKAVRVHEYVEVFKK